MPIPVSRREETSQKEAEETAIAEKRGERQPKERERVTGGKLLGIQ